MYRVYGDGVCIYNDQYLAGAVNALNPKLNLSDNSAGALEITIPVGNAGYEKLERLSSEIIVKRDKEEIWAGRIISEKANLQNSRILTCEGEFAYFNDTTQPPTEYNEIEVYDFILALITEHNSKVEENKQFEIGAITVEETVSCVTDNETTMDAFKNYLIDKFGGHMRIRRVYDENGMLHKYVDYLKDYPNTNGQTIRFGENLFDFTRDWDMSEYATVLMPRGAKLSESPIESVDAYLDVSSVNGGSRYVTNEEGIKRFGWIEMVVDFEDVTEPGELLQKAKDYLSDEQFGDVTIEVSAVDLRYLSKDILPINLLDNVRCISHPHGMDKVFPVTELSIQLDNPTNSTYTLGNTSKENTLTASTRAANAEILERIRSIPNEKSILDKARDNASSIMNMATQGFVTIIKNDKGSESLVVSSESANVAYDSTTDTWKEDVKMWKWNINGLGYSKDGGRNFTDAAITMDGAIVANFITTGTMSADRIRTGIIVDQKGNTKWDLNSGILTMKKGSISLGISEDNPKGLFSVNDDGYLTAEYGMIGGFKIDAYSIYNDVMNLNSNGLNFYHSQTVDDQKKYTFLGNYGTQYWVKNPDVHGLAVNMEHDAGYIVWSHKDNASDDLYTAKLLYTAKELKIDTTDFYDTYTADRIHLGTWMQVNNYGFTYYAWNGGYTVNNKKSFLKYVSSTKSYVSDKGYRIPKLLNIPTQLTFNSQGGIQSYEYMQCYICNGLIMIREDL